ncbi:hypothetical protein [Microbacterium sp.]|uniref:hypothetical protein n=1 Tax=Microbacterium sp. TaxID=51671 RepID=UPI0033401145
MRKTSAALAALALTAVVLTGCSAAPTFAGASCDRTDAANGIDQAVTVKGDLGAKLDVKVDAPTKSDKVSFHDAIVGKGTVVTEPGQVLRANLSVYSGKSGEYVGSTGDRLWTTALLEQSFPGIKKALACVTGGSRVVGAVPGKDLGAAIAQVGLTEDDTMVFVADVTGTMLPHADGSPVFNDARGVPTVVRGEGGRPGIIIPDAEQPTKEVVQTLIDGSGQAVGSEMPVFAYTAVNWDTPRDVASSTWDTAPETDLTKVPEDVAKAITGAKVGSQLLVVTPGAKDKSAVAYVVDILGTVPSGK